VSVEAQGGTGGRHAAAPEAVAIAKGIANAGGLHVGHHQALGANVPLRAGGFAPPPLDSATVIALTGGTLGSEPGQVAYADREAYPPGPVQDGPPAESRRGRLEPKSTNTLSPIG